MQTHDMPMPITFVATAWALHTVEDICRNLGSIIFDELIDLP